MNEKEISNLVDKCLKFECPGLDEKLETPYVIVAPARGDNHLRVYAYGGLAGGIGCRGQAKCTRASKDYVKYLGETYTDELGHEYNVPEWLEGENPVKLWTNRCNLKFDGESYLSLTAAALQNRSRYHDERREQTRIARKFMSVKPEDDGMLVGKNEKMIKEYIRNQLEEDYTSDQISMKEFTDPFTGEKRK